jgi:sec-independent protein translocase protein TatA
MGLSGIGFSELLLVLVVVLLLFGSKRLPGIASDLGAAIRDFRRTFSGEGPVSGATHTGEGPASGATRTGEGPASGATRTGEGPDAGEGPSRPT